MTILTGAVGLAVAACGPLGVPSASGPVTPTTTSVPTTTSGAITTTPDPTTTRWVCRRDDGRGYRDGDAHHGNVHRDDSHALDTPRRHHDHGADHHHRPSG